MCSTRNTAYTHTHTRQVFLCFLNGSPDLVYLERNSKMADSCVFVRHAQYAGSAVSIHLAKTLPTCVARNNMALIE